jgi:2-desacetyl-2-hydroxyethyl bacteriochlorophyllide A dehydrogenase
MGKVIIFKQPREIGFDVYEDQPLKANEVRLQTLYSGISAGTELTAYRGSNPYLSKRWDEKVRLFSADEKTSLQYPISGWGYEECGRVVETGEKVEGVKPGDIVYGTWGHRTHHILSGEIASRRLLPANLDPILGIFSQMGAISLNGVLDAAIRIGETVAIFGLGPPGQIAAQLAKRSGARVIGVDLFDLRLDTARELGAVDIALPAGAGNIAEQIKALSGGRGADVAIEASGAYPALQEAIRSVAYSAKVIALGFFQGGGESLFLGEEFHHNRVNVVCSQIFGVSPELTYRWDRERLVQTAMQLQSEAVLNLKPIITQVYPFSEAAEAFRLCDYESEKTIQVVLDFSQ